MVKKQKSHGTRLPGEVFKRERLILSETDGVLNKGVYFVPGAQRGDGHMTIRRRKKGVTGMDKQEIVKAGNVELSIVFTLHLQSENWITYVRGSSGPLALLESECQRLFGVSLNMLKQYLLKRTGTIWEKSKFQFSYIRFAK